MTRWHAFVQLILARLREFFREPVTIFWVYGFPLLLALLLGLAFSSGKPEPPAVDVAEAGGQEAGVVAALRERNFLVEVHPEADCRMRLRRGKVALYLVVKDAADVAAPGSRIEYVFDPSHAEAVHARNWVDAILLRRTLGAKAPQAEDREIHEPGSRYIDFLLPGLVGINIMGGGLFGVGFVLVDMRVRKLFKRLLATPLHRGDFMLALLTSRLVFLLPEMASLLIVARWLFGVPVLGSWATLALVVLSGALAFAGLGLLLGCRTDKIETISGLINLFMLPMYLLSGVFFSARRFPEVLQPLIQALPLTHLNDALRAVMLEGAGLLDLGNHLAILGAWAAVSFFLALRWFRWA